MKQENRIQILQDTDHQVNLQIHSSRNPLSFGPAHEIFDIIPNAHRLLKAHVDVYNGLRGLNFSPSHHLHPYFVYVSKDLHKMPSLHRAS